MTRMYRELASWWTLLSPPEDYAEEAAAYERVLLETCEPPVRTLLELGSGGGHNASHLKRRFDEVVLVDLSPEMLANSRTLNPECEHVEGDMRTIRLHRQFDCVFVHDAVMYMTTDADLRQAIATAAAHCRPGGAVLFAPDFVRETFRSTTDHGGEDEAGGAGAAVGRGMRFLEWTWDPDPADSTYLVDYAFVLRERDGSVRIEHDRHIEGLFSRDEWRRFLTDAGFEAHIVPVELSDLDRPYEIFACRKPRA